MEGLQVFVGPVELVEREVFDALGMVKLITTTRSHSVLEPSFLLFLQVRVFFVALARAGFTATVIVRVGFISWSPTFII